MSVGERSREHEPSAFGWIFGTALGAAAIGAGVWAVVNGRRSPGGGQSDGAREAKSAPSPQPREQPEP